MRDAVLLSDHTVVPDVRAVAPVSTSSQPVVAGQANWTTQVVGTTAAWPGVRHRTTVQGRFFTSQEVADGAQVAVLGSTTASQLYGPRTAVGQVLGVNGATLTVVGVLDTVGSSATTDEDDQVLMPQTTYASRVAGSANPSSVSTLYLQAGSQDTLSAAYQEADAALLTAHGVSSATPDFTISSQQSILEAATATDRTLTVLLGGVAAISLLVGGIGVMNIMLVSVAERVREIGLRKALGATPRAVRRQFLVEAGSLGATGGLFGMGLGLLGAWLLPRFLGQPVTISPVAAAGSLAVSLAIGLVAGVYPATRAARLSPIDALRSE
jgi:putative ABC transport system permease protein